MENNKVKTLKSKNNRKEKRMSKSEKVKKHYFRTFYYSFCTAFIVFGLIAIVFFLFRQDKNIFGFSTKYYEEAVSYAEAGNLKKAEETLYSCIEYDPNYAEARLMLIDILISEHKYDKALELVQESIAIHSLNENYYIQYIKALTGQNKIAEAMDFIDGISANYITVKLSEKRPSSFVSSPNPGTYDTQINIAFDISDNSQIYYTLDGSKPNLNSTKYNGEPIIVTSGTQTIRAFAINDDGLISDEYSATYRIYKSNTPYIFKDEKVENIVRTILGKSTGTIVYGDLEKILTFSNVVNGTPIDGSIYSLEDLSAMENLSTVELHSETELTTLHALSTLKNVKSITLKSCGITDGVLEDISSMIWLEELNLADNFISDIAPITSFIKLKSLNLSGNVIKDITDLTDSLNNLQSLDLSKNMLSDIAPLSGFAKLKSLNLSENLIEDISALSSLSLLSELDISYNYVNKLDGISRLPQITTLNLAGTQVENLSKIASYTKLINLNISETIITDLSALKNIDSLTTLNVSNTGIKDFSPLESTNIKNLTAANNSISNLLTIARISTLEVVDLTNNLVVDLSPLVALTKLKNLNIQGNYPMNLSVLESCISLTMVNCTNTTVSTSDVSALERNGIIVIRNVVQPIIPEEQ